LTFLGIKPIDFREGFIFKELKKSECE